LARLRHAKSGSPTKFTCMPCPDKKVHHPGEKRGPRTYRRSSGRGAKVTLCQWWRAERGKGSPLLPEKNPEEGTCTLSSQERRAWRAESTSSHPPQENCLLCQGRQRARSSYQKEEKKALPEKSHIRSREQKKKKPPNKLRVLAVVNREKYWIPRARVYLT